MSYLSETAANCAGILERGARRMAEAAKREAILKAEMRAAIAEKLGAPSRAVLTLSEAIAATGKKSDSGFYRWAKRHGIKQVAQGRYSRAAIERALADEVGISYRQARPAGAPGGGAVNLGEITFRGRIGLGLARRGKARRGAARPGMARLAFTSDARTRRHSPRPGTARRGLARRDVSWLIVAPRHGAPISREARNVCVAA